MRYLWLVLIILTVTVIFKDGSSKNFDECWLNILGRENKLKVTCGSERGWTNAYNKKEKFSLFDIEKITENK